LDSNPIAQERKEREKKCVKLTAAPQIGFYSDEQEGWVGGRRTTGDDVGDKVGLSKPLLFYFPPYPLPLPFVGIIGGEVKWR